MITEKRMKELNLKHCLSESFKKTGNESIEQYHNTPFEFDKNGNGIMRERIVYETICESCGKVYHRMEMPSTSICLNLLKAGVQ